MNKNEDKYLPLGTVVLLKGGIKKLMITGFMCLDPDNSEIIYDYSGCVYPEGFVSYNQIGLFNHDQIEEVCYMGLVNDEEKNFKESLNNILESNNNSEAKE